MWQFVGWTDKNLIFHKSNSQWLPQDFCQFSCRFHILTDGRMKSSKQQVNSGCHKGREKKIDWGHCEVTEHIHMFPDIHRNLVTFVPYRIGRNNLLQSSHCPVCVPVLQHHRPSSSLLGTHSTCWCRTNRCHRFSRNRDIKLWSHGFQ